jgi:hypothetical protein
MQSSFFALARTPKGTIMSGVGFALLGLLIVVLIAAGGFVIWASRGRGPESEAVAALRTDDEVCVVIGKWLVFRPKTKQPTVGLVLYPGAQVDARSYSPAARAIAVKGYLVVIVPMPLNLAAFGLSRASQVMDAFPEIDRWALGGHSHGGAMAAKFAYDHSSTVAGLVLWASYPAKSNDFSRKNLVVASIYGTLDRLAEGIEARRSLLPSHAVLTPIEGGNHAQFGWYGERGSGGAATVSHEDQQRIIVAATLGFLEEVKKQGNWG